MSVIPPTITQPSFHLPICFPVSQCLSVCLSATPSICQPLCLCVSVCRLSSTSQSPSWAGLSVFLLFQRWAAKSKGLFACGMPFCLLVHCQSPDLSVSLSASSSICQPPCVSLSVSSPSCVYGFFVSLSMRPSVQITVYLLHILLSFSFQVLALQSALTKN